MTQDVANIIEKLSMAERDVVLNGGGQRRDAAAVYAIEPSLFNLWNAEQGFAILSGITKLGIAVREHLSADG